jgi:hypothetical protein
VPYQVLDAARHRLSQQHAAPARVAHVRAHLPDVPHVDSAPVHLVHRVDPRRELDQQKTDFRGAGEDAFKEVGDIELVQVAGQGGDDLLEQVPSGLPYVPLAALDVRVVPAPPFARPPDEKGKMNERMTALGGGVGVPVKASEESGTRNCLTSSGRSILKNTPRSAHGPFLQDRARVSCACFMRAWFGMGGGTHEAGGASGGIIRAKSRA